MRRRPQAKKTQGAPGTEAATARTSAWPTLVMAALVLAAALGPNLSSVGFGFVWDDTLIIGPKLDVTDWDSLVRLWNTPFDTFLNDEAPARYFRPAVLLSLAFDRSTSGENPRGYHVQNLIWYALCCLFVWLLAWEISGAPLAATAGAVLFALHPAHPESVCFISGRTDLMAGAFLFAALWAAARFGRTIGSPWLKLAPAAALLLPGLYAKEVVLLGAPLLPLALWLRDRRIGAAALARATVPVAAAVAIFLGCRLLVVGSNPVPTLSPVEGTVTQLLTSVAVLARYLPILFLAAGLSARHEIVETHQPDAVFAAGLVALLAIVAGGVLLARRRSIWLLPLALFAATLLPLCYVRMLSGALTAERFLFVPSAAIALAVALLPSSLTSRRDAGPLFLAVAAAAAVWQLTVLLPRVAVWRDEGTLYSSMLRDSPESPHVHAILGGFYYRNRELERAAFHYRRAHQLYPESGELLLNLGAAEDEMGATDSAFVHIRELNALDPNYAPGWYALGNLYVRVDDPDSARIAYERSLALMPQFAQAENNLGAVLERLGRLDEAMSHYRRAAEILPGYADAANNIQRLSASMAGTRGGTSP